MRNRVNQVYEKYWNYTAAFTDFDGNLFRQVVRTIRDFVGEHEGEAYTPDKYRLAQQALQSAVPVIDMASQRKRINQLVKLGFIRPFLSGYAPETDEFLAAATSRRRKSVVSKIVYKYANLLNSVTNDIRTRQLAFLIKSLEELGCISERDLATLMTIDIESFGREFATREDIDRQYCDMDIDGFYERKYNQVDHLRNLLGKLDDLTVHDGCVYFKTDADRLFPDVTQRRAVRDPYLQRVYKSELEDEVCVHYGSETPRCMLDSLAHPVLIASHIKPYSHCAPDSEEQFDLNNGLLLNKSFDSLFDLGYMTFSDDGRIVPSATLDESLRAYLSGFALHAGFLNDRRLAYMAYHRANVFDKRYQPAARRQEIQT
ncbi:MAG: HNH endonuclease [Muribaculaceae bacterium]|nr:HNH endonuclease [Muribaculaceae bacterium]